jgi:hypothetical protein
LLNVNEKTNSTYKRYYQGFQTFLSIKNLPQDKNSLKMYIASLENYSPLKVVLCSIKSIMKIDGKDQY